MIDELVIKTFAARNNAHLEHWATTNDARHRALGDFYDSIIDLVDKAVEIYQGNFGRIKKPRLEIETGDTVKLLQEQVRWLEENMDEISQGVHALENVLQDISGLYFKTLYRLENLS